MSTERRPPEPLGAGDRRALLLAVLLLGVGGLGARLFATELFRSRISRDLLLVVGFNLGLTVGAAAGTLAYRRARRWWRDRLRRLGTLLRGGPGCL